MWRDKNLDESIYNNKGWEKRKNITSWNQLLLPSHTCSAVGSPLPVLPLSKAECKCEGEFTASRLGCELFLQQQDLPAHVRMTAESVHRETPRGEKHMNLQQAVRLQQLGETSENTKWWQSKGCRGGMEKSLQGVKKKGLAVIYPMGFLPLKPQSQHLQQKQKILLKEFCSSSPNTQQSPAWTVD